MSLNQYLAHYAYDEIRLVEELKGHGPWSDVVIIPAYGEEDLLPTLQSLSAAAHNATLAIVVINGRTDSPAEVHRFNEESLKSYRGVCSFSPRLTLFGVDRACDGKRFLEKEGVGHARKLGCDLALALYAQGQIRNEWLFTTDADALVPENYFRQSPTRFASALVFPFEHVPPTLESALYEIHLRYYRLGLFWAQSPYAFHTIGSTLAIKASAYAQVRGFPRRNAAEDFYLLNKLAKVGTVENATGRIRLSSRHSTRVPFGTGMSLRQIAKDPLNYRVYHPEIFEHLKQWLAHFDLSLLPEKVAQVLVELGADEALQTARRTRPSQSDRQRHMHTWFDAFRTLKFVHGLRESCLPSVPVSQALLQAPFVFAQSLGNPSPFDLHLALQQQDEGVVPGLDQRLGLIRKASPR